MASDSPSNDSPSNTGSPNGSLALPSGEELQIWLSAFAEGELSEANAAVLIAAMEADPSLTDALEAVAAQPAIDVGEDFRALKGEDLRGEEQEDLIASIMTAVAPAAVSPAHAARLASLATDGELSSPGARRLHHVATDGEVGSAVSEFLHHSEAVRGVAEAGAEHPQLAQMLAAMPGAVAAVVANDVETMTLSSQAADGVLNAKDVNHLAELIHQSPAHRPYREAGLSAFASTREAVAVGFTSVAQAPEAARAGAAALQAINASALQASDQSMAAQLEETKSSSPAHDAGLLGWLSERLRYLAPVAFAGAAAAVFFSVSDPEHLNPGAPDLPALTAPDLKVPDSAVPDSTAPDSTVPDSTAVLVKPENDPVFKEFASELQADVAAGRVALNRKLTLLDDNRSEVLSIETSSQATFVYETEASKITVIWISDPGDDVARREDTIKL